MLCVKLILICTACYIIGYLSGRASISESIIKKIENLEFDRRDKNAD